MSSANTKWRSFLLALFAAMVVGLVNVSSLHAREEPAKGEHAAIPAAIATARPARQAMLWDRLPLRLRARLPLGSEAIAFAVTLTVAGALCIALGGSFENLAFGGDFQAWLYGATGLPYDQRNAVVVGLAMGFAVIPTIFSIAEEAVFGVPKSLSDGSLALGATPWQRLLFVVLPTASPGIFSALMIGLGRAVGETMIVLMATGNTPVMDWNLFEGMRTLAANIAVEMPESEVNSSHYRILFLAALVLFLFTFVVNTGAELIRQRLREKYSSL